MPRISDGRPPAEPTSPDQKDRYRRILRAATVHGSTYPLERVQMTEVAKDAGVAIATLYRYFPSKTALFTAVLQSQVHRLDLLSASPPPGHPPYQAVADLLIGAARELLKRPLLAHAMLQSNSISVGSGEEASVTTPFREVLLKVAGIEEPDELDQRLLRVVEQAWYGILISALNGHITPGQVEEDTQTASERLLHDLGDHSSR